MPPLILDHSTAWPRSGTEVDPELPVLHRLAIVYLMPPVVAWLVGWFERRATGASTRPNPDQPEGGRNISRTTSR